MPLGLTGGRGEVRPHRVLSISLTAACAPAGRGAERESTTKRGPRPYLSKQELNSQRFGLDQGGEQYLEKSFHNVKMLSNQKIRCRKEMKRDGPEPSDRIRWVACRPHKSRGSNGDWLDASQCIGVVLRCCFLGNKWLKEKRKSIKWLFQGK